MSHGLPTPYQHFIHLSRYSRWMEEENRRETWKKTVARYFDFFDKHLGNKITKEQRKELEEAVRQFYAEDITLYDSIIQPGIVTGIVTANYTPPVPPQIIEDTVYEP